MDTTARAPGPRGLFGPRRLPTGRTMSMVIGLGVAALLLGTAVVLRFAGDLDANAVAPADRLQGAGSPGHLFGTDQLGRDLLARAVAGLWWSIGVGMISAFLVATIGTIVGVWAAVSSGLTRVVLTRFTDMGLAFPYLVLAVTIMAVVGRGFWPLSITLGLVSWPIFARVVYAESMGLMQRDYILAARLVGLSSFMTVVTHVLPGIRNSLLVMWAFMFADLLIAESGLSFLGLGAPLSAPSLGSMLADSREYLVSAPHMLFVPGVTIVLIVVAANLIGDALSDQGAAGRVKTL